MKAGPQPCFSSAEDNRKYPIKCYNNSFGGKKQITYMRILNLEIEKLRHKGTVTCRRSSLSGTAVSIHL